jgi:hypothetical protein
MVLQLRVRRLRRGAGRLQSVSHKVLQSVQGHLRGRSAQPEVGLLFHRDKHERRTDFDILRDIVHNSYRATLNDL